jgi:tyrosinase
MSHVSRRSFLSTTAAVPIAAWASRFDGLQPPPVVTRSEARTPAGSAMLAKYAKAVGIMNDPARTPTGSPLSWTFQWYTHWTPRDKATVIKEVYPTGQPPAFKALAEKTWATCQAHFAPSAREPFFLTWHRWYLFEFEAIIRAVLNDNTFALPYWDYAKDQTLPREFRQPGDPTFKALFNQRRGRGINNRPVNDGDPIDTAEAIQQMVHDALCERTYNRSAGDAQGFCAQIDFNLHGAIHGDIGGDMGTVPTAAQDPIFWLHHCNIDRLWTSWVASGGRNPSDATFLNEPFTFAGPDTKGVTRKSGDCLKTEPLGYKYDRLDARPADCPLAAPETAPVTAYRSSGPVTLGTSPTRVALQPAAGAGRETAAAKRVALVLSGISVPAAPDTVYHVYVNVPDNADAAAREARRVGQVNFFDLVAHPGHPARADKTLVFDITKQAGTAGASNVNVTFAPRGEVSGGVTPTIGEMQIVRR